MLLWMVWGLSNCPISWCLMPCKRATSCRCCRMPHSENEPCLPRRLKRPTFTLRHQIKAGRAQRSYVALRSSKGCVPYPLGSCPIAVTQSRKIRPYWRVEICGRSWNRPGNVKRSAVISGPLIQSRLVFFSALEVDRSLCLGLDMDHCGTAYAFDWPEPNLQVHFFRSVHRAHRSCGMSSNVSLAVRHEYRP